MSSAPDLIILTRTYDLVRWLLPRTNNFPKPYRYTVTQRLSLATLDFQESLLMAQASRGKVRLRQLRRADGELLKVRLYLRLAHEWQWLSSGQYAHVSRMVAEIGRLLGGWVEQAGESDRPRR